MQEGYDQIVVTFLFLARFANIIFEDQSCDDWLVVGSF